MKCRSEHPRGGGCVCYRERGHLGDCRCSCGTSWVRPQSGKIEDEELPVEENSDMDDF